MIWVHEQHNSFAFAFLTSWSFVFLDPAYHCSLASLPPQPLFAINVHDGDAFLSEFLLISAIDDGIPDSGGKRVRLYPPVNFTERWHAINSAQQTPYYTEDRGIDGLSGLSVGWRNWLKQTRELGGKTWSSVSTGRLPCRRRSRQSGSTYRRHID